MNNILTKIKIDNSILEQLSIKNENNKLLFTELGRDMFKGNKHILERYFRNEAGQACYYANLLYFRNIEKITLNKIKNILRNDFKQDVSLEGYKYNPEHYRFVQQHIQDEYEEDLFKFKSNEEENAELEADRRTIIEPIDFEAVETLYKVIYKAIKSRLVMILNLEGVPNLLNNALDCYFKGVSCSVSNTLMKSKIADLKALLENKEVIEWFKTKPTDMSFDRFDYVTTYQTVLRQLVGKDFNLEEIKDLVDNPEDLYQDEILANDYPEFERYIENSLDDDEDYLVNNELFD